MALESLGFTDFRN